MRTLLVALLLALLLVVPACSDRSGEETGAPRGSGQFLTAPVDVGDIRDIIPAVGPLRAAAEVEIGAEVSGRIVEVAVDFNDPVEAGMVLARIDPAPFQSALEQAEAALEIALADAAAAAAELAAAQAEEARLARLVATAAAREAELVDLGFRIDRLEANLRRANANTQLAQGRLERAEIDLARTEIRAPSDGFVLDRLIEEGQAINAVQSAPTLFVIASDLSRMLIEAAVAEADIGRVDPAMDVRFLVDAYPERTLPGEIIQIRRAPVRQGRFVSYEVVVEADNRFGWLLPGMTASVQFVRADARSVTRAPIEALYFTPDDWTPDLPADVLARAEARRGPLSDDPDLRAAELFGMAMGRLIREGKRKIFVATDEGWAYREVRVGGEDETHVEILEGLDVGEEVIIGEAQ